MARAIWSGAISFGLVNIPVKLFSAVSKKTVRFHQIDAESGARVRQKRVGPDDEEIAYEQIVKGYEIGPDRYVTITPEELDGLAPDKTRTIDIEDFVDLEEIDPIYYDHPYYLAPDTGAAKAYQLLVDAMEDAGKVAIARVVIRSKENLVAIRPRDGVLAMETMLFADEVVPTDSLDEMTTDATVKTTERELTMARQLIDSLSSDFEPEKYHDEYRERVLDLIERKAQGETIVIEEPTKEPEKVPDLMAALEASIAASKPARRSGRPRSARRRPRRRQPPRARWPSGGHARRGRGRGPPALALQPGQGHVPRGGLHQGAGDRLLHAHRAGRAAAPARPAADAQALPERGRGPVLLREALPLARPRLGAPRGRSRRSSTASATTCRRSSGSPTSPTWSCTRRCRRSTRSCARP